MISYLNDEKLSFSEYHDFLKRTDLGSQYPKEDLEARIRKTLTNRSISITARNDQDTLVGVCFGLTDFSYFLFITDLGVDREFVGSGIGRRLMEMAIEAAGGEDEITVVTVSNKNAYGFYKRMGMTTQDCLFWKCCKVWTAHTIQ
jgi:ribosomal protein S18 acetylase RimI-like enzyme